MDGAPATAVQGPTEAVIVAALHAIVDAAEHSDNKNLMDNPMVAYEGLFWSDAKKCHDNLVHAMELMGYAVFSEEFNTKKKRPMRRSPHRA